jgi:NTP pyrophosphatase (non-canonical NTP hydrolase)
VTVTQPGAAGPYSIGSDHWPGVTKVLEECGELIQVLAKLQGAGGDPGVHWDGKDVLSGIIDEAGDVLAALEFLMRHNPIVSDAKVNKRMARKVQMFEDWHKDWSQ